MIIIVKYNYN